MFDLHTHTTCSDGTLTPSEIIKEAHKKGLIAIALTDHDTTEGNLEAMEASRGFDMDLIPGVEISAQWPNGILHILGYYIDPENEDLSSRLGQLRRARNTRITTIVERLGQLNIRITEQDVYAHAGDGSPGRPHVANALVEKEIVQTRQEAFDKYLAKGAAAYVPKKKMPPEQSIRLILGAGGIPVIAHPHTLGYEDEASLARSLDQLKEMGLIGLEAYYPRHSQEQTSLYLRSAKEKGLLVTAGTDFHGANKPDIQLGVIPGHSLPLTILDNLRACKEGARDPDRA